MKEVKQLTRSGYKDLQEELRHLIDVELVDVKTQLTEARAQGDLSENADYDAARDRLREINDRIKEIEDTLDNAVIIEDKPKNVKKVALGSTIRVKNLTTGKEAEYTIVDTVEADPFKNWISQDCLVGSCLIGKSLGQIVEIKSANPYKLEILEIKFLTK
ncbi:MAG: transcription elongation factor GreA [Bacilli bacterium]|nr:transcription elongation factor GreA [Bacilli bacterium]